MRERPDMADMSDMNEEDIDGGPTGHDSPWFSSSAVECQQVTIYSGTNIAGTPHMDIGSRIDAEAIVKDGVSAIIN